MGEPEPPTEFPDYSKGSRYSTMDADYWRVFPGSLYALLERNEKYPNYFPSKKVNRLKFEYATRWWSEPLVAKATKTGSHGLGFYDHTGF